MGVLSYLRHQFPVELVTGDMWSWDKLSQCDLLFMQRPYAKPHAIVFETAKEMGIPVVLDYDDNLFIIPRSNQACQVYGQKETQHMMAGMIANADAVIVSTPVIGQSFLQLNKNIVVIPNAFNDFIWNFHRGERAKVITWRGGATHHEDMEHALPGMRAVAKDFPDWQMHFLGVPHWGVDTIEKAVRHEWNENFFGFFRTMIDLRPAIHIVPLVDHEFNRGKSNVGFIEATIAGAVTVAPALPEWERPGVIRYDEGDFEEALRFALNRSEEERNNLVAAAQQWMAQALRLSEINHMRMGLFQKLVKGEPVTSPTS